jgi:hypothetical protein
VDRSVANKTLTLTAGANQAVSSFVCATSGTRTVTINSTAGTSTLTKTGGGVLIDYISLANNTGAPAGIWHYGTNNTIGANVNGWTAAAVPTVTTQAGSDVEETTATGNGTITDTGGVTTARGICYSLVNNPPTIADSVVPENGDFAPAAYTRSLVSLSTGRTYYLRAYATNGSGTGYSAAAVTILTKPAAPTGLSATDGAFIDKVVVTWTKSTGATDYHVFRDAADLGAAGDVATVDDAGADPPTITPGNIDATDGTSALYVTLSISGESSDDGTIHTYKVIASNATGNSADSNTNTGYRGHAALTYQWQVSAADSDAAYGDIGGATTHPYDYTGAPAPYFISATGDATDATSSTFSTLSLSMSTDSIRRYYKCVLSATDATPQTTAFNTGFRGDGFGMSYVWKRSAADADAAFSVIVGGTTDPYNDTSAVDYPDGRYYYCTISMLGAADYDSTHDRGNKSAAPTVTTQAASSVEETTATGNGNITSNGGLVISEKGICYMVGVVGTPTTLNTTTHDHVDTTGAYTEAIAGLSEGTAYRFRAYAINATGTGYGTTLQELTKPLEPTLFTAVVDGDLKIKLQWTVGTGATGTMVRFRTDGIYPTGIADGTQAYYGPSNIFAHNGLVSGTQYSYRIWAYSTGGVLTTYSDLYASADCTAMLAGSVSAGYTYKKTFVVTGSTCGDQTNYPVKITVNYGAGADSGSTVYVDSKSQTDFDDIRFTASNGTTVLDAWLESKTNSVTASIWVELDTIPVNPGTQTFYMYYGKPSAVATWSGANTFTVFDDFERSANGDTVGGLWTETTAHVHISTTHNIGTVAGYSGTRSMQLVGGAAAPIATIPAAAGVNNYAIQFRYYKEELAGFYTERGDGTNLIDTYYNTTEDVTVYDGASYVDTTLNCSKDAWGYAEFYKIDWAGLTMTVATDGTAKTAVDISNASATYSGVVGLIGFNNAGDDTWVDNFIVRKYCYAEPTVTSWSAVSSVTVSLAIQDAKVITGYKVTGDWLVLIRYMDTYAPYFDTYDVRKYFVLQLLDGVGTVKAQNTVPAWGNRVGSIYLANTSALTYGGNYSVRLYGTFAPNPSVEYTLIGSDWLGDDLTNLDAWAITSAKTIQAYDIVLNPSLKAYTTSIATRGTVLTATGGDILTTGLPGLSVKRPQIFQIYTTSTAYTPQTGTASMANTVRTGTAAAIGPDAVTAFGAFGQDVMGGLAYNQVIALIAVILAFGLAAATFPFGHTTAANVLCIGVVFAFGYFGFDWIWIGMIYAVSVFLLAKKLWIDTGI